MSNIKKLNIGEKTKDPKKETIFIENNNYVYEIKMTFKHMNIVNAIEKYIGMINTYTFEVKSEDAIVSKGMSKKYFPYVGKFRLNGNLKATNNYFVPIHNELLNVLFLTYKNDTLIENSLRYIDAVYVSYDINNNILEFLKNLVSKIQIEILNKYSVEDLNYSLDGLIKISNPQISEAYSSLKKILEDSIKNKEIINRLGLSDKFVDAIKVKEKDEECDAIVAKANGSFYKEYYKHN